MRRKKGKKQYYVLGYDDVWAGERRDTLPSPPSLIGVDTNDCDVLSVVPWGVLVGGVLGCWLVTGYLMKSKMLCNSSLRMNTDAITIRVTPSIVKTGLRTLTTSFR